MKKKGTFKEPLLKKEEKKVQISAPKFNILRMELKGTSPYVQFRFYKKSEMQLTHEEGLSSKSKTKKEPRDFNKEFILAQHQAVNGWIGIPAASFRAAMVSACRIVGFKMTLAKLAVFIEEDGFDLDEGTPLVKINGKPEMVIHHTRNSNGKVDLRARPMWRTWSTIVRVKFDADLFLIQDIINLMIRVGAQVGIGEGRADSKSSAGMGWGFFDVAKVNQVTYVKEA